MFSFHKPKIYRSNSGCCICRAKSSSSRFTDSKKYEPEFERCFRIVEKRSGEICNACVLLVKRWKKLPSGTNRNWHHVVDARAGPGTKSFKNKPISSGENKKRSFNKPNRNISALCKESKGINLFGSLRSTLRHLVKFLFTIYLNFLSLQCDFKHSVQAIRNQMRKMKRKLLMNSIQWPIRLVAIDQMINVHFDAQIV